MADFSELKAAIRQDIKDNTEQEITGNVLQGDLLRMVDDINAAKADQTQVDGIAEDLGGKVDKVEGKGLSSNDFTDADKDKLAGIEAGPKDNVFWAIYGTTTAAEIQGSVDGGQIVVCNHNNQLYVYVSADENYIYFSCVIQNDNNILMVTKSNNAWTSLLQRLESITSNKVSTIFGYERSNSKYPNTKAVYDAIYVRGVISQTITRTGNTTDGYEVTVSNPVMGDIPKAIVELLADYGAQFDAQTGYFTIGTITDVAFSELLDALKTHSMSGYKFYEHYNETVRVILPFCGGRLSYSFNSNDYLIEIPETIATSYPYLTQCEYSFASLLALKRIKARFYLASMGAGCFTNLPKLEEVNFQFVNVSLSFAQSKVLSLDSVLSYITHAGAAAITLTLHADVYAAAMADQGVLDALAAHTNVTLASA